MPVIFVAVPVPAGVYLTILLHPEACLGSVSRVKHIVLVTQWTFFIVWIILRIKHTLSIFVLNPQLCKAEDLYITEEKSGF